MASLCHNWRKPLPDSHLLKITLSKGLSTVRREAHWPTDIMEELFFGQWREAHYPKARSALPQGHYGRTRLWGIARSAVSPRREAHCPVGEKENGPKVLSLAHGKFLVIVFGLLLWFFFILFFPILSEMVDTVYDSAALDETEYCRDEGRDVDKR